MKHLLLACALLTLPFAAAAQDDEGEGYLTRLIQDNLSGDDRIVDVQGFEGALSSRATVDRITVADSEGVWLLLDDVVLDWNRSALLRGRIDVQELTAELIRVERAPISNAVNVPSPEATPFSLPELPVGITLDTLDIARIELGDSFLGEALALSLTGSAQLSDGEGTANVTATRLDGKTGVFAIDGSYDNDSKVLDLTLDVEEGEDGIVARLINLPDRPSLKLTIQGEAPISEYAASLALATSGQDRITGDFAVNSTSGQTGFALNIGGDLTPLLAPDYQGFFGPDVSLVAAGNVAENGSFALTTLDLNAQSLTLNGQVTVGPSGWPDRIDLSGTVANGTADPVLLPISGPKTYVDRIDLAIQYDQSVSNDWTADFDITAFDRPGLGIDKITLQGGGIILNGNGEQQGQVTADLSYAANGLQLDDAGAAQAFGDELTGRIALDRIEGQPTEITALTLNGPGITVDADAVIQGPADGLQTQANVAFDAQALGRFSTLAGRNLGGSAKATVIATVSPLDGMFDILLNATTMDLAVDIAQLDPLLAGTGDVSVRAVRDTAGTRVEDLRITTEEASVTADADITSGVSTGEFAVEVGNVGLIAEGLSGPAQISGTADRTEAGLVTFDVSGNGAETTFDASGTVEPSDEGQTINAVLNASAADLSLFQQIAGRELSGAVDLTVNGVILSDMTRYSATIDAATQDLQTGTPQVDPLLTGAGTITGRVGYRGDDRYVIEDLNVQTPQLVLTADADGGLTGPLTADANLRVTDIGLVAEGLSGPMTLDLNADRDDAGVTDAVLQVTGPGTDIDADVQIAAPADDYRITGTINAAVAELGPYAALAGQDITGGVDMAVDGTLLPDLSLLDVTLNGTTDDLQVGLPQVDPLLAGDGRISGNVARTGPDAYAVEGLNIATPQFTITGSGAGSLNGPLSADLNARIFEIGLIAEGLSGPLTVDLEAERTDSGVIDAMLAANGPGTDITADVQVAAAAQDYRITGMIDAAVADLAPYADLAGRDIAGGVDLAVNGTLLPDLSLLDVTVDGTTDDLAIGIPQVDTLLAGEGRISGQVARTGPDAFAVTDLDVETPQFTISGSANGGLTGPLSADIQAQLVNAGALAQGLSGPLAIDLNASRDAAGTAQVNLNANGAGTDVMVDAQVAPQEDNYRITGDLDASISNLSQYAALAGQPISGGVTVQASGTLLPDLSQLDAQLTGTTSNLAIGNETVDQLLRGQGRVSVDAAKSGSDITVRSFDVAFPQVSASGNLTAAGGGAANGTVSARLADVGLFTDAISGPVTAQGAVGRTAAGGYTLDIDATGPSGITATASGEVAANGNLDLDVNGNAPLGLANPFLEPRRLDGLATFNLSANGPPALSSVTGQISTTGARLAAPTLSQALTDINAVIDLNGEQARIDLTGNVQSGGGIAVSGPVALSAPFNGDLVLDINAVELRDPNLYETVVNGRVTVNGPLAGGALIAGRLELGETNIQVPSSGIGSLGELPDVTHLDASPAVRQTLDRADVALNASSAAATETAASGPSYPLDVRINAPNRIFIRGRGLDAELGGTLTLGGTTSDIVPVGQFDLQRGRISILQQRFDLTEGSASLQGDFIPYIRLVATTESATGTQISIIVEGPANDPEVTFESIPDLPQDEVLSILIFGRDISEISPFQAVQLAAAVGTLAGRGGGGIIDDFRAGIGLDDFDVTTDEEGNAAVRAGKYLSDNVYTDVTIGSDGTTEINLNLDITDEITAKGTAGADGETSIGIYFERDY